MKAVVYRGPNDLRVEEVPRPEPGPGEMLVRVEASGICGTDLKKIQKGLLSPPRIFGHEIAGTVVALGAGAPRFREGQRVVLHHHVPCGACFYCHRRAYAQCATYRRNGTTAGFEPSGGGYAEYVKAMDWIVAQGAIAVPDGVLSEEAVFVEPVNTCLKAVRRAGVEKGQTVLIVGQGPIGLLLLQLCRWGGADVLVSDSLADRLEMGRSLVDAVRPAGRIMVFAATSPGETAEVDLGALTASEKEILTSYSASIDQQDLAARLVFGREIRVRELVTHRFPLERAPEAFALAARPAPGVLKVVLQVRPS